VKTSFLCSVHYEGNSAHQHQPTPEQIVRRNHIVVAETAAEAAELERNFVPELLRNNIARNISANRIGTGIDSRQVLPRIRDFGSTAGASSKLATVGSSDD